MALTDAQKIAYVQAQVDSTVAEATITVYLAIASDRIIRAYAPFLTSVTSVPAQYEMTQCELAARMINRMGAEGEVAHSENGVSRSYDSANDKDLLARIIPLAGVIVDA